MPNSYNIRLDETDLSQLLDGLKIRAQSWERTAKFLKAEAMPDDEPFIVEECSKPEEADASRRTTAPLSATFNSRWTRSNEEWLRHCDQQPSKGCESPK